MKKVLLVMCVSSLMILGFSSCGKYCHCTVSKDNKVLEEYDYNDVKNYNDCNAKHEELADKITHSSGDVTGMSVSCSML